MIWLLLVPGTTAGLLALAWGSRRLDRRAARDIEAHIQQALEIVR